MKKERIISLKIKMTIGILLVCFLVGLIAILSVYNIATDIIDREYRTNAEKFSEAVASELDPDEVMELTNAVMDIYYGVDEIVPSTEWGTDEWNAYMANYDGIKDLPSFQNIQERFREYQEIYDVDCFYVVKYKKEILNAVYIVDGAYGDDECPPGCVDAFDDGIWPDEDQMVAASISDEEVYGTLVSAGYPVMKDGEVIAHVCVDISMNDIKAKERNNVITATVVMVILTIVMMIISMLFVTHSIIKPISLLSDTAKNYCQENTDVVHHAFEKLQIDNHDEISELLSSMKQMEADMNGNINKLIDAKVALKESQELATKDALTGIRNKTAYDCEVKKLEKDLEDGFNEFGLAMVDLNFLKKTNDTYGHEKGNISIRRLCMLVCEVFEHSPVFRIGGDEFIVVLKFRDYKNVDTLIAQFNEQLEQVQKDDSLQPWEKISAAIGYHKFDKTVDKTVDDVFKKADKAMYDRKVAMKAERKD